MQRVIDVLCAAGPRFITLPNESEMQDTETQFRMMAGLPGVIGAVDGSHVHIKAPSKVQCDFVDRTLRQSVNLTAVCKADKVFSFIQAGFHGSAQ